MKIPFLVLFTISTTFLFAQLDKQKIEMLAKTQKIGIGIEAFYTFGKEIVSQNYKSGNLGSVNTKNESLKVIVAELERRKTANAIGVNTIISGSAIVKAGVCGFALVDPEPTTKIVAGGLCLATSKGMDKLVEIADEEGVKNLEIYTKIKLNELKAKDEAKYFKAIQSTDSKAFLQLLNENVNFINELNTISGETTEPNLKSTFEEAANEYSTALIKRGIEVSLNKIDVTNENVAELGKEMKEMKKGIKSYFENQKTELKSIKENIIGLKEDYNTIIKDQQSLTNSVSITHEILLQKMTPEEKIKFLNNQAFLPHLKKEEKELLITKANAEQKKLNIQTSISKTLQGAKDIGVICDNLGINNDFTKALSKGVSIGETLFNTFTNFSSGNYLGAVASFSGLFGKKGPDIAEIRHKQIMSALDNISGQLSYLKNDNDIIKAELKLILESQQQIVEQIDELEKIIYEFHNEQIKLINEVYNQSLYLEILQHENYIQDLNHCSILFNSQFQTPLYDSKSPIKLSTDSMLYYLKGTAPDNCEACINALNKNYGADKIPAIYKVKSLNNLTFIEPENNIELQKKKTQNAILNDSFFTPIFNFSKDDLKNDGKSMLMALLTSFDVKNLITKLDSINNNASIPSAYIINDCIDPKMVLFMSEYVLRWNFLSNYIKFKKETLNYGGVYKDINEIISLYTKDNLNEEIENRELDAINESSNIRNISLLRRYIEYLNICIIQQTTIDGDYNLKKIDDVFMKNKPEAKELINIINRNPILANNYIMYHCYVALNNKDSLSNNLLYSSFYSKPTSETIFKKLLNLPFNLKYEKENELDSTPRWRVGIGTKYYNLPNPFSLRYGVLTHNNDLIELLTTRKKMSDAITSYEMIDNLKGKDRETLNELILGILE